MKEMLLAKGASKVSIADLSRDDMAEAVEDAFRMSKLIVAASSYDANVFPPMYDFLHHLQLKNYQKRRVGIIENGSWAPCAGRVMQDMLNQMKDITIAGSMVTIRSCMKDSDVKNMEMLAEEVLAED
jgi:flavorubredoxin